VPLHPNRIRPDGAEEDLHDAWDESELLWRHDAVKENLSTPIAKELLVDYEPPNSSRNLIGWQFNRGIEMNTKEHRFPPILAAQTTRSLASRTGQSPRLQQLLLMCLVYCRSQCSGLELALFKAGHSVKAR
jgi:hypothetical protein